ncbi:MAG: hypothetical protein ACUVRJ_09265 [Candidatus Villigracilaceae bacterium]
MSKITYYIRIGRQVVSTGRDDIDPATADLSETDRAAVKEHARTRGIAAALGLLGGLAAAAVFFRDKSHHQPDDRQGQDGQTQSHVGCQQRRFFGCVGQAAQYA